VRIAFVAERPTQFEAPFFRFAARDADHALRAFFTDPAAGGSVRDPELGREVDWGVDLLAGYANERVPHNAGPAWWTQSLRAGGFDLVVVNGYTRPAYLRAALGARRSAVRAALRLDTVLFERRPSAIRRVFVRRGLAALFDRFLATGSLSRAYLLACGLPPRRVGLLPYAVDADAFRLGDAREAVRRRTRARLQIQDRDTVVLALCKLSPREAPWELLRASVLVGAEGPRVLIGGDGPQRAELECYARAAALDRVSFIGYVAYGELPALYAAADLFVHAPREERWGVSVAEALASGLPVVASSRVGAGHDLVVEGGNGFLYDSGNVSQLASRIRDALRMAPERVAAASREVLGRWGHQAAWRALLAAAAAE
jgi:glycosyltransferase involved in cell wall biosynthesis